MIGGKVLDSSALAAHVRGSVAMGAWLEASRASGLVLFVPLLAFSETRVVFPGALGLLGEVVRSPQAVLRELSPDEAPGVARLLGEAGVWDVCAGHVVWVARRRGWPVITADPGRLTRVAPDLDLDLL